MTAGIRETPTPAPADPAVCSRPLHAQIERLVAKADKLRNLCDRRGREPSDGEKRRMRELSAELATELAAALAAAPALAEDNLARPPDTPADTPADTRTPGDGGDIDQPDYELVEP